MRRREFVTLLGSAVVASPRIARAQQPERMRRIGWLEIGQSDNRAAQLRTAVVREDLEKLGWVVGRNLQIDYRWGIASPEAAQRFGAELLSLSPDVIFCTGSPATKALQQATSTVPIVFVFVAEPVEQGFVQSLAHPGGNITGFAYLERTIGAKWLALLTEVAPQIRRVVYIFSPNAAPYARFYYEAAQAAGEKVGVQVGISPVAATADFEPALAHLGANAGAIFNPDAVVDNNANLAIDLTARYRVPAIYGGGGVSAGDGCLITYKLDQVAHFHEVAPYLDRILRGEKPAELPVQQPTKFQYGINLKTAKALGLAVPLAVQMTADEVVE